MDLTEKWGQAQYKEIQIKDFKEIWQLFYRVFCVITAANELFYLIENMVVLSSNRLTNLKRALSLYTGYIIRRSRWNKDLCQTNISLSTFYQIKELTSWKTTWFKPIWLTYLVVESQILICSCRFKRLIVLANNFFLISWNIDSGCVVTAALLVRFSWLLSSTSCTLSLARACCHIHLWLDHILDLLNDALNLGQLCRVELLCHGMTAMHSLRCLWGTWHATWSSALGVLGCAALEVL